PRCGPSTGGRRRPCAAPSRAGGPSRLPVSGTHPRARHGRLGGYPGGFPGWARGGNLRPPVFVSTPRYHDVSIVGRVPGCPGKQNSVAGRLVVRGAREHNLKDVSLDLPRDALIVFPGLSGSGKSSLAFDTIFAEGQRRYGESLSAYARQFLGQMDKPDVDFIDGLSPAVSIDQKAASRNPRSTVGTIT